VHIWGECSPLPGGPRSLVANRPPVLCYSPCANLSDIIRATAKLKQERRRATCPWAHNTLALAGAGPCSRLTWTHSHCSTLAHQACRLALRGQTTSKSVKAPAMAEILLSARKRPADHPGNDSCFSWHGGVLIPIWPDGACAGRRSINQITVQDIGLRREPGHGYSMRRPAVRAGAGPRAAIGHSSRTACVTSEVSRKSPSPRLRRGKENATRQSRKKNCGGRGARSRSARHRRQRAGRASTERRRARATPQPTPRDTCRQAARKARPATRKAAYQAERARPAAAPKTGAARAHRGSGERRPGAQTAPPGEGSASQHSRAATGTPTTTQPGPKGAKAARPQNDASAAKQKPRTIQQLGEAAQAAERGATGRV